MRASSFCRSTWILKSRARPPTWVCLEQCAVGREEYETLRELARLEAEGRPPSIDDLRRSL